MLKQLRSSVVSPVQPRNMPLILLTLPVSQPLRSRLRSLVQLVNMKFMYVTFEVFHALRSSSVNAEQP